MTFLNISNSGGNPIHLSASGTFTSGSGSVSVSLDRTGYWVIYVTGNTNSATQCYRWTTGGTPQFVWNLSWPGGSINQTITRPCDGSSSVGFAPFGATPVAGIIGPGAVSFAVTSTFALIINLPVTLEAWFIPTPAYR